MIPQEKYHIVISDATWNYAAPGNPGAYVAAALAPGVSAAQQEQLVAQHKEEQMAYADYLGSKEAGKELLLYGVGDDALAPLKKQYQLWRFHHPFDDTPRTRENGDQDDDVAEVRIQGRRVREAVGPNNEHHGLLHRPRQVSHLPRQQQHLHKRGQNDNGGWREDVGK